MCKEDILLWQLGYVICYYRKRWKCDLKRGKVPNLPLVAWDIQQEETKVGKARNESCVRILPDRGETCVRLKETLRNCGHGPGTLQGCLNTALHSYLGVATVRSVQWERHGGLVGERAWRFLFPGTLSFQVEFLQLDYQLGRERESWQKVKGLPWGSELQQRLGEWKPRPGSEGDRAERERGLWHQGVSEWQTWAHREHWPPIWVSYTSRMPMVSPGHLSTCSAGIDPAQRPIKNHAGIWDCRSPLSSGYAYHTSLHVPRPV